MVKAELKSMNRILAAPGASGCGTDLKRPHHLLICLPDMQTASVAVFMCMRTMSSNTFMATEDSTIGW